MRRGGRVGIMMITAMVDDYKRELNREVGKLLRGGEVMGTRYILVEVYVYLPLVTSIRKNLQKYP